MKKKESEKKMEKEEEKEEENQKQPPPPPNPSVSPMKPLTRDAYGGGIYGTDDEQERKPVNPPASATQSADGPEEEASVQRKQKSPPLPPSTGIEILISPASLIFSD